MPDHNGAMTNGELGDLVRYQKSIINDMFEGLEEALYMLDVIDLDGLYMQDYLDLKPGIQRAVDAYEKAKDIM